jgi:hypothetical protein
LARFSLKGQVINILGFVDHVPIVFNWGAFLIPVPGNILLVTIKDRMLWQASRKRR